MNKYMALLLFLGIQLIHGQGIMLENGDSLTHLGSINGPLAGPNIYAEFFVGDTASNLTPVLPALPHGDNEAQGYVMGVVYYVPGNKGDKAGTYAYVQMAVWDSTFWGIKYDNVPSTQVVYTDIVPVEILPIWSTRPYVSPIFNELPVVPAIPEPSISALLVVGGLLLAWAGKKCR
jgi:hypothetical protein